MINIRLPQINGATDKERIEQIKSYLIYLVNELQWALNNIDANGTVSDSASNNSVADTNKATNK